MTSRQTTTAALHLHELDKLVRAYQTALIPLSIDGVRYRYNSRQLSSAYGNTQGSESATYHLYLSGHYLGDIALYTKKALEESALSKIEQHTSMLSLQLSELLAQANRDAP